MKRRVHDEARAPPRLPSDSKIGPKEKELGAEKRSGSGFFRRWSIGSTDDESVNSSFRWFRSSSRKIVEEETCSSATDDVVTPQTAVGTKAEQGKSKQVRFDTVHVRTYERIVGDNPYSSLPLGIGWAYNEEEPRPLDEYDETEHEQNEFYVYARKQRQLSVDERRGLLRGAGYTEKNVREAECRRKVQVAMEWCYRFDHPDKDIPCPIPDADRLIKRFIL